MVPNNLPLTSPQTGWQLEKVKRKEIEESKTHRSIQDTVNKPNHNRSQSEKH